MCSCLVVRGHVSVLTCGMRVCVSVLMFGGEGGVSVSVSVILLLFCADLDLTFSFDAFRMDK